MTTPDDKDVPKGAPEDGGRVILLGESNPYGSDPSYALWPDPPNCAGHRLCHLVLRLDPDEYLRRYDRRNLFQSTKWWAARAHEAACRFVKSLPDGARVVLLGAKVWDAIAPAEGHRYFRARGDRRNLVRRARVVPPWRPFDVGELLVDVATLLGGTDPPRRVRYACLPHPSGLSRYWNEPGAFDRAREAVARLEAA